MIGGNMWRKALLSALVGVVAAVLLVSDHGVAAVIVSGVGMGLING